ncbi:hypothetical protein NLJ89_g4161 [Agrocybe chaxingu]|uniref:Manganese lipoxygenase n=1 Tax=Agrocybe chaxingu TaxID=84603 RepID=A0A9W8MY55_9AGAR|nr:hypothetical protein NLJ89_g4161 [Agrocybe chaxingu]
MCAQVSDWAVHEFVVHLVNTHLVEEAIIVGAQRSFPDSHILITLLKPHWNTTLSLNALARELMLPELYEVCRNAYEAFDFTGSYVPADLERRGFPLAQLDDPSGPFHNYAYARNVIKIWDVLRRFVASVLSAHYPNGDADIVADEYVSTFCTEMQSAQGGGMSTFPTITTLDGLIDMVTMCIHIAAPQHSAVNYLQQYYLTFVPNKPAALYSPLPTSLEELQKFGETDVLNALPLKLHSAWLLMAQIPYLLSAEVESEDNIITYADTVASLRDAVLAQAGKALRADLTALSKVLREHSRDMDDQTKKYDVLDPIAVASSIII